MDNLTPLSSLYQVEGRFLRSVHLEKDFYTENPLEGYVLSTMTRESIGRLIRALEDNRTRAFTITGPYGTGKSAFALFVAKLFGSKTSPTTKTALKILHDYDQGLWERIESNGSCFNPHGFCSVLISGTREPLGNALIRNLATSLKNYYDSRQADLPKVYHQIQLQLERMEESEPLNATELAQLFEDSSREICSNGGSGLLLIVDELGKFLEYASQDPSQTDMFALQVLAETASRSGQAPLLMIGILHQAFEEYAGRLDSVKSAEWKKVQGRFEDVAFIEPSEQVTRLIEQAIIKKDGNASKIGRSIANQTVELELVPDKEDELVDLLYGCLPLHPTVTLALPYLFRRYAQNERSLFSFLGSTEPEGFSEFISRSSFNGENLPTYTLADLHEYMLAILGGGLYTSINGSKWAEIESSIERLADPKPTEVKLIRSIGLLGILGEAGVNLKASEKLLYYALDDGDNKYKADFDRALKSLMDQKVITYRRYNDAYAIWEGSDIDIEEEITKVRSSVEPGIQLKEVLNQYLETRPIVARRHSYETGTLRYFSVRYTDIDGFDADLDVPLDGADGLVLYVLPKNDSEAKKLVQLAKGGRAAELKNVLVMIPRLVDGLLELAIDLVCLHRITEDKVDLASDRAARRELGSRLANTERRISELVGRAFGQHYLSFKDDECQCYRSGKKEKLAPKRKFNALLSDICYDVYSDTPILRNELINRQVLKAQAAKARNNLIKAMIECSDQKDLGIEGNPPEKSIYDSLLVSSGIHNLDGSEMSWKFRPPNDKDDQLNIGFTWQVIEEFLQECEDQKQPVIDLYKRLKEPPIGLRDGPLPIFLCAAIKCYQHEIALYEDDAFVKEISDTIFGLILKSPERFKLKRFRIEGLRTKVFEQFATLVNRRPSAEKEELDLIPIVGPIVRFEPKLPQYSRSTKDLSSTALNIRQTLRDTREPDELLFKELPQACGFAPFDAKGISDQSVEQVNGFFQELQRGISELSQVYEKLLDDIKMYIISAFGAEDLSEEEVRLQLANRARSLSEVVIEQGLKSFLINLCGQESDLTGWCEAIGNNVVNKHPSLWLDLDKEKFEIKLAILAEKFRHYESVYFEHIKEEQGFNGLEGKVIRVGVTTLDRPEQERVMVLTPNQEQLAEKLEEDIKDIFEEKSKDQAPQFQLAVLAQLSQKLMQQLSEVEE